MTAAPITGFPLQWPAGRPLLDPAMRDRSPFKVTPGTARNNLIYEVRRLGGTDLVISSNVPLKKDGTPYAGGYRLDDEAVAAYFKLNGDQMVFACDRWWRLHENMHAIAKTIEAIRGIERWGSGDMLRTAMSGFAALPPPTARRAWWEVLGVDRDASRDEIRLAFKRLASLHHPDKPLTGSHERMAELNAALQLALTEARSWKEA